MAERANTQLRIVNRLRADGTWEEVAFLALKKGDSFKMHEQEGTKCGCLVYRAESDAYPYPQANALQYVGNALTIRGYGAVVISVAEIS